MLTMDNALQDLVDTRFISGREAYEKAISKDRFKVYAEQANR